jgi:hypothetical protein
MKTQVVHCKKEPYQVYIGRGKGSKWGNPFTHIADRKTKAQFIVSSRKESIEKYREWILEQPELLKDLEELKGKILGCWCMPTNPKPDKLYCHGQILVELIEKLYPD